MKFLRIARLNIQSWETQK